MTSTFRIMHRRAEAIWHASSCAHLSVIRRTSSAERPTRSVSKEWRRRCGESAFLILRFRLRPLDSDLGNSPALPSDWSLSNASKILPSPASSSQSFSLKARDIDSEDCQDSFWIQICLESTSCSSCCSLCYYHCHHFHRCHLTHRIIQSTCLGVPTLKDRPKANHDTKELRLHTQNKLWWLACLAYILEQQNIKEDEKQWLAHQAPKKLLRKTNDQTLKLLTDPIWSCRAVFTR